MNRIGDNVNGRRDRTAAAAPATGRALRRAPSGIKTPEGAGRLPGSDFGCRTRDGVELSGRYVPGPPGPGAGPAFVIGHGFTHGIHKPATRAVMAAFAPFGAVVAVDFRGHGRSGGRSSVGRDETHDLDAAVQWARSKGHGPVTVIGFSMGAAIALRHASIGHSVGDAVVAVSSPARWYMRESRPMRKVHWLLEAPMGPVVGRMLGVRLGEPWLDLPASPVEAVAGIGCPLLLIHGAADPYFNPLQARALQRASGTAELWIEIGMGHGETATTPALAGRIAAWAAGAIKQPERAGPIPLPH